MKEPELNKIAKRRKLQISHSYLSLVILDKVCELMNEKNITNSKLARRMKISTSEVSRLLSDNRNLTIKTIAKLFYALGEELEVVTSSELTKIKSQNNTNRTWSSSYFKQITFPKNNDKYKSKDYLFPSELSQAEADKKWTAA